MKRVISFLLALVLFCAAIPVGSADSLTNPFTDVDSSDYFYIPVVWAVYYDITTGTSATTFSPNAPCTRAQVVTFLWRTVGSPDPLTTENPFEDVAESAYYFKAVMWAVENGITTGTSDSTFSPDASCTRAQVVTFLHRACGSPAPQKNETSFRDISADAYYYEAVLWAVERGITTGTSAVAFSPETVCNRGQIVTFLYRTVYSEAPLSILSQTEVFYMGGAYCSGDFDIEVTGGVAPYFYQLVLYINDEVKYYPMEASENSKHRLSCSLGGEKFTEDADIRAYIIVEDSSGAKVTSKPIKIYTEFVVDGCTNSYVMTSERETAAFEVSLEGGTAPFTYQWVIRYGYNNEVYMDPVTSSESRNRFEREFTCEELDPYYDVKVYCIITDSHGREARSAQIPLRSMFRITKQPKNCTLVTSTLTGSFSVETKGGLYSYSYNWYVAFDDKVVSIMSVLSSDNENSITYNFKESDFTQYKNIYVYCVIRDGTGKELTTDRAKVTKR